MKYLAILVLFPIIPMSIASGVTSENSIVLEEKKFRSRFFKIGHHFFFSDRTPQSRSWRKKSKNRFRVEDYVLYSEDRDALSDTEEVVYFSQECETGDVYSEDPDYYSLEEEDSLYPFEEINSWHYNWYLCEENVPLPLEWFSDSESEDMYSFEEDDRRYEGEREALSVWNESDRKAGIAKRHHRKMAIKRKKWQFKKAQRQARASILVGGAVT